MSLDSARILVVDDNPHNHMAIRAVLRGVDASLDEAGNGFDALSLALAHEYALILLDVQMPEMDGFEVCEQLRADARTVDIPVIFLTAAFKETADRMRAYVAGATDYLTKPIDDHILKAKVLVFLKLYEQQHTLKSRNQELLQSNQELEQFAYIASHDLRQPLRMMNSYVQLLERRLDDKLNEETRMMMGFVRDGAARMDQMLMSLLEYSRIGRSGEPMELCDVSLLLEQVLADLALPIKEREADIQLPKALPWLWVSCHEFSRLLQNLISNALKFCPAQVRPQIQINVQEHAQYWQFAVRDNGIGIPQEQHGRLFQMFQRLHTREQYDGTGIGLALARKIVQRHGGEIWVSSPGEGRGTCFEFTVSKKGSEHEP